MKKLLLALFLFTPSLHAYDLPYSVDDTAIYENLEYLIGRIQSLDTKFILNNSTSPGFTQFYVTSGTITDFLSVPNLGTRTNVDLSLYANNIAQWVIKNGGELRANANGVASTPLISWINDTNLGIYRKGVDVFGFSANGSNVFEMAQSSVTSLVDFYTTNLAVASILSSNGNTAATVGTGNPPVIDFSTSPTSSRPCASGFDRVSPNKCWDADNSKAAFKSSTTISDAGANSFDVQTLTDLNGINAKIAYVRAQCYATHNAVAGDGGGVLFCVKSSASGSTCGDESAIHEIGTTSRNANDDIRSAGVVQIRLDAGNKYTYSVRGFGSASAGCDLALKGYED